MNKIVFSDVDGTLLNSNHQITYRTEDAIKKLQKKNIPFVIISARSPSGIYPILEEYQLCCTIISYSGSLILNENREVLLHRGMSKMKVKKLISYLEENQFDMAWCVYSLDDWVVKDKNDPRIINEETIVKAVSRQGSVDSIIDDKINKILCICNPTETLKIETKLKADFPGYSIVKSSDILLEIMEKNITKATGVETLCSLWNIPLEETIAFGDHYNDIEMLKLVGQGFLMANAPKELKELISLQTLDNDQDGIHHALLKLGLID